MPFTDAYEDDVTEDPMAYLDAYNNSDTGEFAEYSQSIRDKEEQYDDPWYANPDMPKSEAEEDLCGYEPDTPEYPDMTEDPEMPKEEDEEHDWPTTRMASLVLLQLSRWFLSFLR